MTQTVGNMNLKVKRLEIKIIQTQMNRMKTQTVKIKCLKTIKVTRPTYIPLIMSNNNG